MNKLSLIIATTAIALVQLAGSNVLGVSVGLQDEASVDESYDELVSELVTSEESRLTPAETLNQLRRFAAIYSMREDEASLAKARQIDEWMELGRVSDKKCTGFDSLEMNAIIENNSFRSRNILPYLENCRSRQFEVCKAKIQAELGQALEDIEAADKHEAQDLLDTIDRISSKDKTDELYKSVPHGSLVDGVLAFVGAKKSDWSELEAENGQQEFTQTFRRLVNDPCISVMRQVAPLTDYYVPLLDNKQYTCQIEKATLKWMSVSNVCREIFELNRDLVDLAYQELKPETQRSLAQVVRMDKLKKHTD